MILLFGGLVRLGWCIVRWGGRLKFGILGLIGICLFTGFGWLVWWFVIRLGWVSGMVAGLMACLDCFRCRRGCRVIRLVLIAVSLFGRLSFLSILRC